MRASGPSMRPRWRRARPRRRQTGKKPGGRAPQPPVEGPLPADQVNLTDEESRIMPVAGGGFEQCYNAQAVVAADSLLVVAADVVQAPNDKQQLEPMLGKIAELPGELGKVGDVAGGQRLFQREQRECLRRRRDRAGDRDGAWRRIIPRWLNVSQTTRRRRRTPRRSKRCAIASRRRRARSATPCASRRPSRCSASSSRCLGSASSCCAASTRCAASGNS